MSIHGIEQPDRLQEGGPAKMLELDWIRRVFFEGRRTVTAEQTTNDLREAQVLFEGWRRECYLVRPHSSLGYRPWALSGIRPSYIASGPTSKVVQEWVAGHQSRRQ